MVTATCPRDVAAWRGPNDPPGSQFRARQTFEIYGYWPREVFAAIFDAPLMAPESMPIIVEQLSARIAPDGAAPILSLIRACLLVEDAAADHADWTPAEMLPYVIELQHSVETLLESLNESAQLDAWLRKVGLSE